MGESSSLSSGTNIKTKIMTLEIKIGLILIEFSLLSLILVGIIGSPPARRFRQKINKILKML